MTQMVDLSTPEGIYEALGRSPRFSAGQSVTHRKTGRTIELTGVGVSAGSIVYDFHNGTAHAWAYESQLEPVTEDAAQ